MKKTNANEATTFETCWFGLGNVANNLYFVTVTAFLMFFFTNIMGLDTVTAGTIFMAARLVDAVTDPLMGTIIDRTNFKHFGKFRGYLHFCSPLLAVVFVCMFTVPDLSMGGKILYAYLIYILYSVVWTTVQVPQMTVPILMSNSVANRTKVQAIVSGMGTMTAGFVVPLIYKLLNVFGGEKGMMSAAAWNKTAIVLAVIASILMQVSTLAVRRLDTYVPKARVQKRPDAPKVPLKEKFSYLIGNVALFAVLVSVGTDMFATQINAQTTTYFWIHNMNRNFDLQSALSVVTVPTAIILMFISKPLVKRFGKKTIIIACECIAIASLLLMLITNAAVPAVILQAVLGGFTTTLCMMMCRTALFDVSSYTRWKTGVDASGFFSSTYTCMNKFFQAFAAFVGGWILKLIAFDPKAEALDPSVVHNLLVLRCVVPIVAYVITIIAMKWYPITKQGEIELQEAMDQIRAEERAAVSK